jgi:hypothetical protein
MKQYDTIQQKQKYQFTISPRKVKQKPNEFEKKQITRDLTLVTGLTISDFSKYVAKPYAYTWSGGVFNGTRSNANWTKQYIFALDFDNTISVSEVLSRFKQFDIAPQLWYKTLGASDTLEKFRVVLFLAESVSDIKMHSFIINSLLNLFPEADQSCKDAGRYFFGGKESFIVSTSPISTSQLIDALSIYTMASDSGSTRKLPLDQEYYANRTNARKGVFLYNKYRSSLFSAEQGSPSPTSCPGGLVEKFDFDKARMKIRIFDEFLNGTWLHHMELFGLATNLIHVKGGIKLMKETMLKFNQLGVTDYTENNFKILPYVKKVNYHPQPVCKFSPYEDDNDKLDLVSETKDIRGYVEQSEPIEKIGIEQAEHLLKEKFKDVIKNGDTGKIYLFKLPTAIGKTQLLLDQESTIALPTNSLKNEVSSRMKIKHVCTPDSVAFQDESINSRIAYYHQIGLPKKAMGVIHHMVLPENIANYDPEDIHVARKYLIDLERASKRNSCVLTTHRRALFSTFNHDTLIFDEDPLSSLMDIRELKISDVFALNLSANVDGIGHLVEFLKSSTPSEIRKTPTFSIKLDDLVDKLSVVSMTSNIIDFLSSSYFIRDEYKPDTVYYVVQHRLPKKRKIVIMSASLPIDVYKNLYKDRVEVIDISDVLQTGEIRQYTSRSCSRNGLSRYVINISNKVGDLPVITFKAFSSHFKNAVDDMYFGNCSGYDSLKGKDIAVVGTPHRNQVDYLLTASAMGIEFGTIDTTMTFQKIEYGGFKFKFNCFDNDDLRAIQLALIESDLIQAVGRARTLRTDSTVHLYSNFPLRLTTIFQA